MLLVAVGLAFISHNLNTQNVKVANRDRTHIIKLNDDFYPYKYISTFYVADKIRLGTVFVQHRKMCKFSRTLYNRH